MAQEGAGALMRGWQPRVIWIGVGGSVFFTVLEASKKLYAPNTVAKPCCAGKKSDKKKKN
jgi:solute carrier family 25 S-adenosylmethionine transporter 26